VYTTPIVLLASAARTASLITAALDLKPQTTLELVLDVTAVSGLTPTLAVSIEMSSDGVGGWLSAGTFVPAIGLVSQEKTFSGLRRYVRARADLSLGASFTFSVLGQSVLVYGTPDDIRALALPPEALADITDLLMEQALQKDSAVADGYLARVLTLPLLAWSADLTARVCDLAAYRLMKRRGFDPEQGADKLIVKAYDDAIAWFKGIAAGSIEPVGMVDQTPEESDSSEEVYIVTELERGW